MNATLSVITGPMFCGKSEELTRRLSIAAYANARILLVKPAQDNREDRNAFEFVRKNKKLSRYRHIKTTSIKTVAELRELINDFCPNIIALDEVQFFPNQLPKFLDKLLVNNADSDLEIVASGLDMNAWREPYPITMKLLAMANSVDKKTSVCLKCRGKNGPAVFTHKKGSSKKKHEIGSKMYGAACRSCHTIPGR